MSTESSETEYTTLGDHLQQTRIKQELDLEQVSNETKITIANLKAMEDNNFGSLPAEAFTRGFYTLYAKLLSLDPDEVLRNYTQERHRSGTKEEPTPPPHKMVKEVGSMTTRPLYLPFYCSGLIIFFFLIGGAFFCWYFSWNPAAFLSEKLRNFQNPPKSEQVIKTPITGQMTENLVSDQSDSTAGLSINYVVKAFFPQKTEVTLKIDEEPKRKFTFAKGESVDWKADKKMEIILPPKSVAELTFNGIPINLPQTNENDITILIPEYLLDQ